MPFQISPGVNVSEIDLTTIIPGMSTTDGAFAGLFNWGPVDEITLVDNQTVLLNTFGKPDTNTADYWFTASNFLDYGDKLHLIRVVDSDGANNATETDAGVGGTLVQNRVVYENSSAFSSIGKWIAKYPGDLGNSIRVSVCDSYAGQYSNTSTAETANGVIGQQYVDVTANTNFNLGDRVVFVGGVEAGEYVTGVPATVGSAPSGTYIIIDIPTGGKNGIQEDRGDGKGTTWHHDLKLNRNIPLAASNMLLTREWEFYNNFDSPPGNSAYGETRDSDLDEIHIAVSDATGKITGTKGTVLETFPAVSKASDAKTEDGTSNYYKDVINQRSKYIWWAAHPAWPGDQEGTLKLRWGDATTAGTPNTYTTIQGGAARNIPWLPDSRTLIAGNNGHATSASPFQLGYDKFRNSDEVDISLVLGGPADGTVATYIIDNVAEERKDCVAFISPQKTDVVNVTDLSTVTSNVKSFRLTTDGINSKSSSYAVMDSGWKYQYDKFNDIFRWVPLNADIAGLCVRTDTIRDAWWSPAGLNRGSIKNVVRLAWNPRKAHRDELYKNNINPVVTLPGQGTVLFGDKTLQAKPSAFDRINVRRLFILLEKAIAIAAKFTLFEFNDEFTRSQFRNMVEPFLRDVKGRRGIFDFRVVCDHSNNTPEVIDRNEFIGDIYIKPARSINYIQLNFVAVRTGVDFSEVVGNF